MADLPAPQNKFVKVVNVIIDGLVLGLGEDAVIAQAVAVVPWLGFPIIGNFFRAIVNVVAVAIDQSLKNNVDNLIIRFQGHISKILFDQAFEKWKRDQLAGKNPVEDLDEIKKAIDRLIHRGSGI